MVQCITTHVVCCLDAAEADFGLVFLAPLCDTGGIGGGGCGCAIERLPAAAVGCNKRLTSVRMIKN